jgi:hypothetical protein
VSYQSSDWEQYWLRNVEALDREKRICQVLLGEQRNQLREFLELLCTSRFYEPHQNWCIIDDGYEPLFFNTANRENIELTFEKPLPLVIDLTPAETIAPDDKFEHILSKFTFYDEATGETYTEYIEPLVAHLRFPLYKCLHPVPATPQYKGNYLSFRGWIIPPPPVVPGERAILFDSSGASWESKLGGASPAFFADRWLTQGVAIDEMWIFGNALSSTEFYDDVPPEMLTRVHFQHGSISAQPEGNSAETPFLPQFINEQATINDYVILRLDANAEGIMNHVAYLSSEKNHVDELVWERRSESTFPLNEAPKTDLTLLQSYEIFLMLRQKGIRAHASV